MTDVFSWLPLETGRELGWTLIHFLWQGLLLAVLLNAVLPLCRGPIARHNWALATLVAMALAPVVTFLSLHHSGKGAAAAFAATPLSSALISATWMDWLVLLWLAGIVALSLRALGGWYLVQSLKHRDTLAVPADLLRRCHGLQRRLRMGWPVRFSLSSRIDVPVVIGFLRPMILIPVSAVAGLAPQQLDALILHELAHIRRLDTAINILLTAVETLLFYHPAVWWVGRQVRIEREHCCDDFAVSACGDAALYVEALTSLELWRAPGGAALAASGGRLKDRVVRLLDAPSQAHRVSLSAMTGLALLGLVAVSVAMAQAQMPKGSGAYPSRGKNPVTLRPIMETHQLPPYPKQSIHDSEEGRVLVEVAIGTDGTVSQATVVGRSGHERLDVAAANFVKGYWRWQPPTQGGKPVTANTRVSVLFKLGPKSAAPVTR